MDWKVAVVKVDPKASSMGDKWVELMASWMVQWMADKLVSQLDPYSVSL